MAINASELRAAIKERSRQRVIDQLFRPIYPQARVCIREEFEDYAAPGCINMYRVKKWTFHYNDGTTETLKTMYCQKPIGPKNTKFTWRDT